MPCLGSTALSSTCPAHTTTHHRTTPEHPAHPPTPTGPPPTHKPTHQPPHRQPNNDHEQHPWHPPQNMTLQKSGRTTNTLPQPQHTPPYPNRRTDRPQRTPHPETDPIHHSHGNRQPEHPQHPAPDIRGIRSTCRNPSRTSVSAHTRYPEQHRRHSADRTHDTGRARTPTTRTQPGRHYTQTRYTPTNTTNTQETRKPVPVRRSPDTPRVTDVHGTGSSHGKSRRRRSGSSTSAYKLILAYQACKHSHDQSIADTGPSEPSQLMPLMRRFPWLHQLMPSQASPSPRQPALFFNVAYSCMFRV